jgi:hypothetical protein
MTTKPRSQNHLAELLGINKATCSQQVRRGMPTDSVEAAQAWRRAHLDPARRKPAPKPPAAPSQALSNAAALMQSAALVLAAGGSIETLVPALRSALAAVPGHERDAVGLDLAVMRELVAHVLALADPGEVGQCTDMSPADAQEVGEFWYSVAAGEWQLNP